MGDCPRPLEGRQPTVDLEEPLFLHVDLELLLLFLTLVVDIGVAVADCWLDLRVFAGLTDYWLGLRVAGWLGIGLRRLAFDWL